MKYLSTFLMLFFLETVAAQSGFPDFLQGTWKMEGKEVYEHWDKLNEHTLKGLSYQLKQGEMQVSEYLEIALNEKGTFYTASVLQQNQGKAVSFKLTNADSAFVFENPEHDFPKKIVYQRLNDTELFVQVSDGAQNGFAFKMEKQFAAIVEHDTSVTNPHYDSALAQKLGADDYGMKGYILVLLKTGPNKTTDKTLISNSFRGHLENINHLVKEGKMIVAGPLGKNDKTYRGIFVLNVTTFEDAEKLLRTDAAIKEGLLDFELYNWYGSAALPEYLEFSDRIWKIKP